MEKKNLLIRANLNYNDTNRVYLSLIDTLNKIVLPEEVKEEIIRVFQNLIKLYFINKEKSIVVAIPIDREIVFENDGRKYCFPFSIIPGIDTWEVFIVKDDSLDSVKPFIGIIVDTNTGDATLCNKKENGSLILELPDASKKEVTHYGLYGISIDDTLPYSENEKDSILRMFDESFVINDALDRNMPYRKEDGFDYSGFYKTKKHGFTMIHRFLDKNGFVKVVIDENATVLVFNIIMDIDENSLYYKPIDYSSFITLCPNFNFRKLRELLYKAKENGFDTSNIPSELLISPKQIIKDK